MEAAGGWNFKWISSLGSWWSERPSCLRWCSVFTPNWMLYSEVYTEMGAWFWFTALYVLSWRCNPTPLHASHGDTVTAHCYLGSIRTLCSPSTLQLALLSSVEATGVKAYLAITLENLDVFWKLGAARLC